MTGGRFPTTPGYLAVAPLREAFLKSGLTAYEVARRMELYRMHNGYRVPDEQRVKEYLGLKTYRAGHRRRRAREAVSRGVAWDLCCAMGLDPVDVGL